MEKKHKSSYLTNTTIWAKNLLYRSMHLLSLGRIRFSKKNNFPQQEITGLKFVAKPIPHVLIQSQSLCRQVFLGKTSLKIPKNLGLGDLFARWLGECLGCMNIDDPAWNELRKIFIPIFRAQRVDNEPLIDDLIAEWNKEIRRLFETSTDEPIPIELVVAGLPLKFILRKTFGATFLARYEQEFQILQNHAAFLMVNVFRAGNTLSKWRFYRYLPTRTNAVLKDFNRKWEELLINAGKSASVKNEGVYWDLLANYENAKSIVSFKMFSRTLVEIVFANKDVAEPSAAWLLAHYTLYPAKLSTPSNFIEESARLAPISPISMPKITTTDIILDNKVIIRKGTIVYMDFVALGKSLDWRSNNLHKFRPERFDDQEAKNLITRFGIGGRQCPGGRIANQLFIQMLELLKQNWLLLPSHPMKLHSIKSDHARPFNSPLFKVWIQPKDDLTLQLHHNFFYYDCPPKSELMEHAFMAISISKSSPFLKDQNKTDMAVKLLAERPLTSVILLGDEIARFNLQAFDHCNSEKAKAEARELGDRIFEKFQSSIMKFGKSRVLLLRWSDLDLPKDIDQNLLAYPEIKRSVSFVAKKFLAMRGQGKVNKSYKKKLELGIRYILSEVPILVCGIRYQNIWYRLLYYCGTREHLFQFAETADSVHQFALDILTKPEFSRIKKKIGALLGCGYKVPGLIGIDIESKLNFSISN